ncbi:hypothetical protein BGZ93_001132 [Podila epicladia]|nr:hypothetical protein BGZ93_001132 [Podila epicladia]
MGILPSSQFPLLVVLNPHSGMKQSLDQFNTVIQPALAKVNRNYTLIESTTQGHAQDYFLTNIKTILTDLVQSLTNTITSFAHDASNNSIPPSSATLQVMVVGGDGTVHEIVNGVLRGVEGTPFASEQFRPRIEFAVIPTGTGNAIATSLGIAGVQDAIDRFLVGKAVPLRVMTVSTRSQDTNAVSDSNNNNNNSSNSNSNNNKGWVARVYTVVVNSFGLHCATVYDSDAFRHLGNERFRMAAMKNVENLKQYKGQISVYGDVQTYDRTSRDLATVSSLDATKPTTVLPGPFTYLLLTKQAFLEPGFRPTPLARTSDEWMDLLVVQNAGQAEIMDMFGGTATGEHIGLEKVEYLKVKALELETPEKGRLCIDGEFMDIEAGAEGAMNSPTLSTINTPAGKVLCVADLRGNISQLDDLVDQTGAKLIIHCGDFGFYERDSLTRISDRTLKHLVQYSTLIPPSLRTRLLQSTVTPDSLRQQIRASTSNILSELPLYLSGQKALKVPLYTVWGACEDVSVLEKFRNGEYTIPNLNIIDESATAVIDIGGVKLRLFGLGGAIAQHKLFDIGDGTSTIAGGSGTMWTTALQIGQLVDTAQKVFDATETRILISHASPGREGILAQLALVLKADFTISAGLHFRYGISYNEFGVQGDQELYRNKLANAQKGFMDMWEGIKGHVESHISDEQRILLDNCLSVVNRLPAVGTLPNDKDEAAFKNMWNFNLPDAASGLLLLDINQGKIATETRSQGFNFSYRRNNVSLRSGSPAVA